MSAAETERDFKWHRMMVGNLEGAFLHVIAKLVGAPELITDPRFVDNTARMANREQLAWLLGEHLRQRPTAEWLRMLDDAGIPAGPIHDIEAMANDPQTLARQMVVDLQHPVAGATKALGLPIKLGATPGGVRRPGWYR